MNADYTRAADVADPKMARAADDADAADLKMAKAADDADIADLKMARPHMPQITGHGPQMTSSASNDGP